LLEIARLEESRFHNPALFGFHFDRQCICEIPGQVPCPGWEEFPKEMTGKYKNEQWMANKEASDD
jgi:small subunit ribosomal protein S25